MNLITNTLIEIVSTLGYNILENLSYFSVYFLKLI